MGVFGKQEPTAGGQLPDSQLREIGCVNTITGDFIELKLDISKKRGLLFLLDTGAEISIVKRHKLIGSTRFDPQQKVKLKSIDGSVVETLRLVEAQVRERKLTILMKFQLVNKQIQKETE
jgi:hypothetical protein